MIEPRREVLRLLVGPRSDVLEMAFRELPAGSFRMGTRGGMHADEEPVHAVTIPAPFWMAETPVTQGQFSVWRDADDYESRLARLQPEERELQKRAGKHSYQFVGHTERPAENITWFEANAFCDWLNEMVVSLRGGQNTDWVPAQHRFQLPSEAHWEYACRAGSNTEYASGDGEAALRESGQYSGNASESVEVGRLKRNAWGLFDTHGNIWEWCADVWDARAYRKRADGWLAREWTFANAGTDARKGYSGERATTAASARRVVRGGSWGSSAGGCRSAVRNWWRPDFRFRFLGFRASLLPGPSCPSQPARQAQA